MESSKEPKSLSTSTFSMFSKTNAKIKNAVKAEIVEIPRDGLTTSNVYVIGNDPKISGLAPYKSDNQIGLVATSCFRGVQLACELGNVNKDEVKEKIPQLVILDNSRRVIFYWEKLIEFTEKYDSEKNFLGMFNNELASKYRNLTRSFDLKGYNNKEENLEYLDQDEKVFLENLFKDYGFDNVRNIILSTILIGQSWADKPTFVKLNTIFENNGILDIYTYPSNIVPIVPKEIKTQILENINILKPRLTIHTSHDKNKTKNMNEDLVNKVHLVTDQNFEAENSTLMNTTPY